MRSLPSSLVLIVANLAPIGGVLWLDWSVYEILLLYWTESVVIGVINVLRMAANQSENLLAGFSLGRFSLARFSPAGTEAPTAVMFEAAGTLLPARRSIKAFMIPFFMIHYGVFCFGHLSAVVGIFSGPGLSENLLDRIPPATEYLFWVAVAFIFLSHLFSFVVNYLGKGEYRRTGLVALMQRPYGRIVVMHLTIIVGAGLIIWLGNPLAMLLALVGVKIGFDLKLHNRERGKFAATI